MFGLSKITLGIIAALALALVVCGWLLLDAHEALGKAELVAKVNAETIDKLEKDKERSQKIAADMAAALTKLDGVTREIRTEILHVPVTMACVNTPAVRAYLGELRKRAAGQVPAADAGRSADKPLSK